MRNGGVNTYDDLKRKAISHVIEQLQLHGEGEIVHNKIARHDILIKNKNIKIKVKFSKPMKRSKAENADRYWEFKSVIHATRLWPKDIIDFYILIGFNENGEIERMWKLSVNDQLIYRKNYIFIPVKNPEEYSKYEYDIYKIQKTDNFQWIG